jgi:hypothetical protein
MSNNNTKPTIEEIEEAIPDEQKNMSFGGPDEDIIDVMIQAERKTHEYQDHDGSFEDCPECANK